MAGAIGIVISYALASAINVLIANALEIHGLAQLTAAHSAVLVLGSMFLTLIAGLIPAKAATKKDPVIALRTE